MALKLGLFDSVTEHEGVKALAERRAWLRRDLGREGDAVGCEPDHSAGPSPVGWFHPCYREVTAACLSSTSRVPTVGDYRGAFSILAARLE
jgi:hypothetical protein